MNRSLLRVTCMFLAAWGPLACSSSSSGGSSDGGGTSSNSSSGSGSSGGGSSGASGWSATENCVAMHGPISTVMVGSGMGQQMETINVTPSQFTIGASSFTFTNLTLGPIGSWSCPGQTFTGVVVPDPIIKAKTDLDAMPDGGLAYQTVTNCMGTPALGPLVASYIGYFSPAPGGSGTQITFDVYLDTGVPTSSGYDDLNDGGSGYDPTHMQCNFIVTHP